MQSAVARHRALSENHSFLCRHHSHGYRPFDLQFHKWPELNSWEWSEGALVTAYCICKTAFIVHLIVRYKLVSASEQPR